MIDFSKIVLPSVAITLMAACTSNPRIQSDYSDDLNFGEYKTFNFSDQVAMGVSDLASELETYVGAAVSRELNARGLATSNNSDILISVTIILEEASRPPKSQERRSCPRYEDYYSRKTSPTYGGSTGASRRPMCVYAEGQITIELMDVKRNQQLMKGVSRVRIDENDRGARLKVSVGYDVATIFGESPVRVDEVPHYILGRPE